MPTRADTLAAKHRAGTTRVQGLLNAVSAETSDAPIYFLHIPKTAGSSLRAFLESLYDKSEICGWFPGWAEILRVSQEELARSKVICGHLGACLNNYYDGELRPFTFVREPLGRALSHYEHVLRDTNHYFHAIANELETFGAFMRDPRTQPTVSNFQTRHLAANLNPEVMAAPLTAEQLAGRELERLIDTCALGMSLDELLERAHQNLDRMCFVGVTEQFDRSLGLLCEIFGWPAPETAPVTNVNPRAVSLVSLSDADRNFLTELNGADLALYESAKSRFEKDWARSRFVYPDLHAFVSYAQNFEDVLLHRVLADVDRGVYIDVGANDPTGDSVTRAFYDSGWRGINVEPVTLLHQKLLMHRPRDINLQIASGAVNGETCLYEIPGTGLSTLDGAIADRHASMGFAVQRRDIKVQTLDSVLNEHPLEVIHFLKVDVEGWEREVLEGIDLTRHRPWIVVVEATEPNSQTPSFAAWESLLVSRRYQFAYFDGLNRYYVADEHSELLPGFSHPVNSADHFIRWSELSAKRELRRLNWGLRRQAAALGESEAHVAALSAWATSADEYGKALLSERDALNTKLATELAARETERREAASHLAGFADWATSADAYGKSLLVRATQLESELSEAQVARSVDRANAEKQIAGLTEWAKSADAYAKSLLEQVEQLCADQVLAAAAHRDETAEATRHIGALTEWATSADAYGKSLLDRNAQLEAELSQAQLARSIDGGEAMKQIDALTAWATSADGYAKSLIDQLSQRESELRQLHLAIETEREELNAAQASALSAQRVADEQLRHTVDRATRAEHDLQSVRARYEGLVKLSDADRRLWLAEKTELQSAADELQQQLIRLTEHWAVRVFISKKFVSPLTGTKKHD